VSFSWANGALGVSSYTNDYPGDLIVADVNRDGFPDILAPNAGSATAPLGGYVSFLNSTSPVDTCSGDYDSCPYSTPDRRFFELNSSIVHSSPSIAVADVDGDGIPDVVRPANTNGQSTVVAVNISTPPPGSDPETGGTAVKTINGVTPAAMTGFSVLDIDGDGTAEILRDLPSPPDTVLVTSPTMNGTIILPHTSPETPPRSVRWVLDLNGDGLSDIAYVNATDIATIRTYINNGRGFYTGVATTLPTWAQIGEAWLEGGESGARVVDYNMDGRQDLLLVDRDNGRTVAVVLLSDGTGSFTPGQTSIPIGDWADSPGFLSSSGRHNYSTTVLADLNGDALPDILQLESGQLKAYLRQGNAPDMVTTIREGTGRSIAFGYGPLSDTSVYTSDPSACASDPQHLACLVHGRWLTKSLTVSGMESSTTSVSQTQTFSYQNGLVDRNGRGFLGFQTRVIKGPASLQTTITYGDLAARMSLGSGYIYPEALVPTSTSSWVSTPQGPNSLHNTVSGVARTFLPSPAPGTIYMSHILANDYSQDCAPATGSAPACSGSPRILTYRWHEVSNDVYGNATYDSTSFYDGASNWLRSDTSIITYSGNDESKWLVHQLSQIQTTSQSGGGESVTRTTNYTPDVNTGFIKSVDIEPTGDATTHRTRNLNPDAMGRLQSVSDIAAATGEIRTTSFKYEDSDGVYVTTTTYPATSTATMSTRVWRHPGYGFVVEADDPNQLPAVWSFDTFGRIQSATSVSGASAGVTYLDTESPLAVGGVDLQVAPGGSPTRQFSIHLDSFGRETSRSGIPIDGTQTLTLGTNYDNLGHISQKSVVSANGTTTTTLNTEALGWDDMDRPISDCKTTSYYVYGTPVNACKGFTYNGLQVQVSDESGRTVTHIADPLGRPWVQQTVIGNPAGGTQTSKATFTYGPFDVLEHETAADGANNIESKTDVGYDVLGRSTSVTRTAAGTRGTTYNAFGEVVTTYKLFDGTHYEDVTYVPDALGRVTSITAYNLARTFYWDASAGSQAGATDPYAIGKLVDVVTNERGLNNDAQIHFSYGPNGMPATKKWTLKPSTAVTLTGTAQWTYDSQGRIDTLTYPVLNGWAAPLKVRYGYDSYTGTANSLFDITTGTSYAMWSANSRNALGQITSESLAPPGPPPALGTFGRTSSYYLQDGRLNTVTLTPTSGIPASLTYSYQADGLPSGISASLGHGANWVSSFDYDNLGRLTTWWPASGAPPVTYGYDSDGKLLSRRWSAESVAYSFNPSGSPGAGIVNSVKTTRGTQVTTDGYWTDWWGRTTNSPTLSIGFNDLDELDWQADSTTGQFHAVIHNGFGQRVVSTTGNPVTAGSTVSYVATLDDLFEFSYSYATNSYEERCRLQAAGNLIGDVVRTSNGGGRTATFYLEDQVGSVMAEGASATGVITPRARRDPFGNLITDQNNPYLPTDVTGADPDGSSRLGYAGHGRDADWGVIDMGARPYSPRLGRFLAADSVIARPFDRREYNPFAYVRNTPTMLSDRDGRCGDFPDEICWLEPIFPGLGGGGGGGGSGGGGGWRGNQAQPPPPNQNKSSTPPSSSPSPPPPPPVNVSIPGSAVASASSTSSRCGDVPSPGRATSSIDWTTAARAGLTGTYDLAAGEKLDRDLLLLPFLPWPDEDQRHPIDAMAQHFDRLARLASACLASGGQGAICDEQHREFLPLALGGVLGTTGAGMAPEAEPLGGAGAAGERLALGLGDRLDAFAAEQGAGTWKLFPDPMHWKMTMLDKLADPNVTVFFNLDGVDVWPGISRASYGAGGATDWELLQIQQHPQWWGRVKWMKNGVELPNPLEIE
jgi:RHS repeat-associated protein